MSRVRSRFERLRRATAQAYGCPECIPGEFRIVEIAQGLEPAPDEAPALHDPTRCSRCRRPIRVQYVAISLDGVTGLSPASG